jgi:hypothetical protein
MGLKAIIVLIIALILVSGLVNSKAFVYANDGGNSSSSSSSNGGQGGAADGGGGGNGPSAGNPKQPPPPPNDQGQQPLPPADTNPPSPTEAKQPVVDCTATPDDPSCPPPPEEKNNTSSLQTATPPLVPTFVPTKQPKGPDNSCTFFPELPHCVPDPKTGLCPPGFSMNADEHCFRTGKCPSGFERRDNDESGTCWPKDKNSPPIICPPGVNPPHCVDHCPKGTHPDDFKICVKNKVTTKIIHVIRITSNNDQNSMVTRNTQLTDQLTVGQAINGCKDITANSPNNELKKSCNIFMAAIFNYCLTHTKIANKDNNICSDDLYLTNVPQYVKENVNLKQFPPTIYNIRP